MQQARPSRASAGPSAERLPPTAASAARSSTALDRWLVRRGLAAVGNPPIRVVLWDGAAVAPPGVTPEVQVVFGDRGVLRDFALAPDPGIPDAYVSGRLRIEGDLLRVIELVFRGARYAPWWVRPLARAFGGVLAPGSIPRARENIRRHYDLGNEFYRLWLDERMVYTCAYFPSPELSLEEAQLAKLDHVCRKLALRPGERVVEAGCGWGALALHMAEHYGVRVDAYNISREQIRYAREQAERRGLEKQVRFVEDDWRNIRGRYDAFASVGMLEHVGKRRYRRLSRVIDACLAPHGRGLVHSIGRVRPQPMSPWLEREIFPGAYIPALREMLAVLEPSNLAVLDVEDLRPHYALTLEHWLARFEDAADEVRARYDERFVRTWRLYLASSIASFRQGTVHLYQIVFNRSGDDTAPWTREHVYRTEAHDARDARDANGDD